MIHIMLKNFLLYTSFVTIALNAQENKMNEKWITQEVLFENKEAEISLAGSLRIPTKIESKVPAIVLIHGYGPVDRDSNFMGRCPFLEISEYFADQGIAVLSYDKRGIGASTGNYATATTADLAKDGESAIAFLKNHASIDPTKIGIVGLSEGGLISTIIASQDSSIAAIVLLGPAFLVASVDYIVQATSKQLKADGASDLFLARDAEMRKELYQIIKTENNIEQAQELCIKVLDQYHAAQTKSEREEASQYHYAITPEKRDGMIGIINGPWHRNYLSYDPIEFLSRIKMPVLMLTAQFDYVSPTEFLFEVAKKGLFKAENNDTSFIELSGLNHAFIPASTGSLKEYMNPAPFAPRALEVISSFLKARLQ